MKCLKFSLLWFVIRKLRKLKGGFSSQGFCEWIVGGSLLSEQNCEEVLHSFSKEEELLQPNPCQLKVALESVSPHPNQNVIWILMLNSSPYLKYFSWRKMQVGQNVVTVVDYPIFLVHNKDTFIRRPSLVMLWEQCFSEVVLIKVIAKIQYISENLVLKLETVNIHKLCWIRSDQFLLGLSSIKEPHGCRLYFLSFLLFHQPLHLCRHTAVTLHQELLLYTGNELTDLVVPDESWLDHKNTGSEGGEREGREQGDVKVWSQ